MYLLSEEHSLEDIKYQELQEYPVIALRGKWLVLLKEKDTNLSLQPSNDNIIISCALISIGSCSLILAMCYRT